VHSSSGAEYPLIDHHCHGVLQRDLDDRELERALAETYLRAPADCSNWESPVGLAVRRWCAPVLDLAPYAEPAQYAARRRELGHREVNRRFLQAAGVSRFIVDTGTPGLSSPQELEEMAEVSALEVTRLEAVAEDVIAAGVEPAQYGDRVAEAVYERVSRSVAIKSVIAYRVGLAFDPRPPGEDEVESAAAKVAGVMGTRARLEEPVLLRHALWTGIGAAAEAKIPLQIHTGFGDPDLVLHRSDPALLTQFLRALMPLGIEVTLLHAYPYHRQAGYLAAMFPHVYVDVGLALNHVGASAPRVLAEIMELTPFHKHLYSSDAIALSELHLLGARLFRISLHEVLDGWLVRDHIDARTAERITELVAQRNADRVYGLAAPLEADEWVRVGRGTSRARVKPKPRLAR
jgi:predicted TIM-barrel fold metal-dependent hydrolase